MDIIAAFDSPQRLCPMPAGPALLEGSRWTVRLPHADAAIDAPRKLLERVAKACDGMSSVAEILDATPSPALRKQVAAMIDELMEAGVLVDAALFPVAAQRFAWVPSPFGMPAEKVEWLKVPQRFSIARSDPASDGQAITTPLDALLDTRRSVRTFDDRTVSEQSLLAYLWLLGGVVHAREGSKYPPRRTVPSGGAVYALRPLVVLRRRVGAWSEGIYAVDFPAERRASLRKLGDDIAWLPRAVTHPWYLSFATGMVFLVADPRLVAVKYRGRALQYMLIESGAALQNAGLAADGLDMATSIYGGYVESASVGPLQLTAHEMIVATAVFGAKPTLEQMRLNAATPHPEFEWTDSRSEAYAMPQFVGRSSMNDDGHPDMIAWGRDRDPWIAYRKSAVEALERRSFRSPKDVRLGRFVDWQQALDPRDVVRYSDAQYRDPAFSFKRFDERAVCGWVTGRRLASGDDVHVLAELVYSSNALRAQVPGAWCAYTHANTSGCAAQLDPGVTIESALSELVERDAFMRCWLRQEAGVEVSARSLPAAYRARVRALESAGCRVLVQRLPSPWAQVCLALAQHDELHFTVVGAAARPTLDDAVDSALQEMELLAFSNLNKQKRAAIAPSDVRAPLDHAVLYTSARYYRRADALLQTRSKISFAKASAGPDLSLPLSRRLLDAGRDVVVVDIAAPNSAIDQGRTPVTVLRAFVPGLVPISFGHNREPLGAVPDHQRGGRFPHPFP